LGRKKVSGELKNLRAREKGALEKLADRRSDPSELISSELAMRASELCAKLGKQIALLIGRDGKEFRTLEKRHPDIKAFDTWVNSGGWLSAVRSDRSKRAWEVRKR
jgi:hypothetical protein